MSTNLLKYWLGLTQRQMLISNIIIIKIYKYIFFIFSKCVQLKNSMKLKEFPEKPALVETIKNFIFKRSLELAKNSKEELLKLNEVSLDKVLIKFK